ncbi:hydantoinase B/oxoprolinase family protein [Cyanobium sp. FGCU-52]|nr:hydantoinase B/oxoprolinase family protein [Cyanobium sp. FGCU52]
MPDGNAGAGGWRFWIDRGGTFTDLVARSPDGRTEVRKVLSEQPEQPGDPAIRALRQVLGLAPEAPLPPGLVQEVRLGTTVATNALLERRVAPVLLLVNRGLADLPRIGDQHRPDLFALEIVRPRPLEMRVVEITGRRAADGRTLEPLQLDQALEERIRQAWNDGYRSIAVALMHAYRHPQEEIALASWLEQRGFGPVHLSHRVSRRARLVPRLATTVVEAALAPVLGAYLDRVRADLGAGTRLRVMTSSGALCAPSLLRAKDTILSGPAGGMVGAAAAARAAGFGDRPLLGFDMGGTSTDVFHLEPGAGADGFEHRSETEIDGLRLQAAMLPIHTVAAGGGSELHVEGGRLQVGPRSAGADPGPACYRRGGPATITDANVLLGRLPIEALPAVFGPSGDRPADGEAVRQRFEELAGLLAAPGEAPPSPEAVARGALTIAIERMAEAIRRISIQRGHDIRGAVLVCFGGAGGQHACALAEILGLSQVLLHPLAGVLSAWGIGRAQQSLLRERAVRRPLSPEVLAEGRQLRQELVAEASGDLRAAGDLATAAAPRVRERLELRYAASDQGLEVPGPGASDSAAALAELRTAFETLHRRRFGYVVEGEPLVLERIVVEVEAADPPGGGGGPAAGGAWGDGGSTSGGEPPRVSLGLRQGSGVELAQVPCWRREALPLDTPLQGPALIVETTGTTVLEPHWQARRLAGGELLLEHQPDRALIQPPAAETPCSPAGEGPVDPMRLELFHHRFAAVAEQMGVRLQQSARSVNIRERLDFSCALFDGQGALVANAPHIPVHLGSMGESVVSLLAAIRRGERRPLAPGDAIASNDPYGGGTHLPDITVITPVFAPEADAGAAPAFYVACRGHHADVGGISPGSMPPFSRTVEEEGLRLANVPLLVGGRFDEGAWRARLAAGPHPVRNPDQLLADLQAQVAANRLGVEELQRWIAREGEAEVRTWMGHVQANAAEAVREVIDGLRDGDHCVELDDGCRIVVSVRIDREARRARVDFSGTSPQQSGNLNAPLAITKAVVLYVFRCLVGRPIPLNAGCFEPIDLVVPRGCLLRPEPPAAVVAGNVETSQAVANALFGALGVMAAAQGTMNNLSFGDDTRQYYETICGGTGAGPTFAGADAVQSHMTNSRLTDPEILEDRFPVVLERFALRRGSGGRGHHKGGDGVERWLRFEAPLSVSLLTGSRRVPPFGQAGGESGHPGENRLVRADGSEVPLPGCAALEVEPGDRLRIATPGGGGYGTPEPAR